MTNTPAIARSWTEFVASRPELLCGDLLLRQFSSGEVTRLCDCGCNSYEFQLSPTANVSPLVPPSERGGCVFELEFQTEESGKTIGFFVFVDGAGNLTGIDVDYCGNSFPMPSAPKLFEPPFHVRGVLARASDHDRPSSP